MVKLWQYNAEKCPSEYHFLMEQSTLMKKRENSMTHLRKYYEINKRNN